MLRAKAAGAARRSTAARALPATAATLRRRVVERAPTLLAQAREEWVDVKPALAASLKAYVAAKLGRGPAPAAESVTPSAAAIETAAPIAAAS